MFALLGLVGRLGRFPFFFTTDGWQKLLFFACFGPLLGDVFAKVLGRTQVIPKAAPRQSQSDPERTQAIPKRQTGQVRRLSLLAVPRAAIAIAPLALEAQPQPKPKPKLNLSYREKENQTLLFC